MLDSSWVEILGFVTGGLCVALTVARKVANFGVGIANCVFFGFLFASAGLWADAGLQVVYIVLGAMGWWQWLYGNGQHAALTVTRARNHEIAWCITFVAVGTVSLMVLLRAVGGSAPFLDALTTSLSLAAQWLLNGKRIQTWYFWIVADCIYIPLYIPKGLELTALVYALFLAMCLLGLRTWRAEADARRDVLVPR